MEITKITYVNLYMVCREVIEHSPNDEWFYKRVMTFDNIDKLFKAFTIRLFSDLKHSSAEVRVYVEEGYLPNPTIYKQLMARFKTKANFSLAMANFLTRLVRDNKFQQDLFSNIATLPLPAGIQYYVDAIHSSANCTTDLGIRDLGYLYARVMEILFYSQQYKVMKLNGVSATKSAMARIFNGDGSGIKVFTTNGQLNAKVTLSIYSAYAWRTLDLVNVLQAKSALYALYIYSRIVDTNVWKDFEKVLKKKLVELNPCSNNQLLYTTKFAEFVGVLLAEQTGISSSMLLSI